MTNTRQQVGVVAPLPAVNNTDITCKINRLQTTVPTVHFVKNRTEPLVPQFCQEQDRIPCSYFLCGDLSIRSLRQIPRNAIPHKNAVFIDTECGGYYSIRGAKVFQLPGSEGIVAFVLDRATIVPPDYFSQCSLEQGIWEIKPIAGEQEAHYGN